VLDEGGNRNKSQNKDNDYDGDELDRREVVADERGIHRVLQCEIDRDGRALMREALRRNESIHNQL
jgi:hypothetical protein